MRVTYDPLPMNRRHPLGRVAARGLLARVHAEAPSVVDRVRSVHFAWNSRTTQEGRVVQRGPVFEIRVNFTVEDGRSHLVRRDAAWLDVVARCGGVADVGAGYVRWPAGTAEQYCSFILFHELAHLVYAQKRTGGSIAEGRGSAEEERFCETWALARLPV